MPTAQNVSYGKPATGGAIFRAPLGTTLPTDATTSLDAAFKSLGFVSEDGLTNGTNRTVNKIKDWSGQVVLSSDTSYEDTFGFTLIEALNPEVLKTVYGDDNVATTSDGITIKANNKPQGDYAWVIDMILREGALKRIVIPCASVASVGEVSYKSASAIGYATTLQAVPDADGDTHKEYIKHA